MVELFTFCIVKVAVINRVGFVCSFTNKVYALIITKVVSDSSDEVFKNEER